MSRGPWKRRLGNVLLALVSASVALAMAESGFELLLRHPAWLRSLPANVRRHVRNYYLEFDRQLVQADPQCSVYDREVTYTLRPGTCRFQNREFDVLLRVNRLGVRDDESARAAPEIVFLGDSFAMGWGVRQEESFPARVRALAGLKTLNTGVASYGTAREVALLQRVDTSALRFLVVQYDANDYWENLSLEREQGHLPIRSRETYDATVRHHARDRHYVFGKYTFEIVRSILQPRNSPYEAPAPGADEAVRLFLHALMTSPVVQRAELQIVAFELSPAGSLDSGFPNTLKTALRGADLPPAIASMRVIDFAPLLQPEHYYDLDDHLRPSGHELVAREIVKALASFDAE